MLWLRTATCSAVVEEDLLSVCSTSTWVTRSLSFCSLSGVPVAYRVVPNASVEMLRSSETLALSLSPKRGLAIPRSSSELMFLSAIATILDIRPASGISERSIVSRIILNLPPVSVTSN